MTDEERVETVGDQGEEPGYLAAHKTEIHYVTAKFHRRAFANLLDFLFFAGMFIGLFLGIRAIVMTLPSYQASENELISIRVDSGMYQKNASGRLYDVVSFLDAEENGFTGFAKMTESRAAIDKFIVYLNDTSGAEAAKKVQDDYDSYRLSPTLLYESVPYFVKDGEDIVRNPSCSANAETYFYKAYAPFIDEHCQGYLITLVPRYLDLIHYESRVLFLGELLPAYAAAPLLTHLLPMMIFRRGRMTFGKALYRIGLVDSSLLVPKIGRTLARFAIFYFAEVLLSPFTFAIPLLVSASLMAFSKHKQGFPDYLLRLHEVDVTDDKIYFSREEIVTSGVGAYRKPVDFKNTYED